MSILCAFLSPVVIYCWEKGGFCLYDVYMNSDKWTIWADNCKQSFQHESHYPCVRFWHNPLTLCDNLTMDKSWKDGTDATWSSSVAQCIAQRAPICSNTYGGWFKPHPRHSMRLTYRPGTALRLLGSHRISHNKFLRANKWILIFILILILIYLKRIKVNIVAYSPDIHDHTCCVWKWGKCKFKVTKHCMRELLYTGVFCISSFWLTLAIKDICANDCKVIMVPPATAMKSY